MLDAGLRPLASIDQLSVNGFKDPIKKLPALIRLLFGLVKEFETNPPDVFIGVDFNVFNLILERMLKKRGIRTVHYVSPSVYAWRRGRARSIGRSADLLLALFPFEAHFYDHTSIKVAYVGHPMADAIALDAGSPEHRMAAREELGIVIEGPLFAILPGSRASEVDLMLDDFIKAATIIQSLRPKAGFVFPCLHESIHNKVKAKLDANPDLRAMCYHGDARVGLTACDAALVKSGTSTLETMLLRRPMVVSYRLGYLSYQVARRLLRSEFIALPNILAGRRLVPELLQFDATPPALAENLLAELDKAGAEAEYLNVFEDLHQALRCDANERAADAVNQLLLEANGAV